MTSVGGYVLTSGSLAVASHHSPAEGSTRGRRARRLKWGVLAVCLACVCWAAEAEAGTWSMSFTPATPPQYEYMNLCIEDVTPAQLVQVTTAHREPDLEIANPDGTRDACWYNLYNSPGGVYAAMVQTVAVSVQPKLTLAPSQAFAQLDMHWDPWLTWTESGINYRPTIGGVPSGMIFSAAVSWFHFGGNHGSYSESTTCSVGSCALSSNSYMGEGNVSAQLSLSLPSGYVVWTGSSYASAPAHSGC